MRASRPTRNSASKPCAHANLGMKVQIWSLFDLQGQCCNLNRRLVNMVLFLGMFATDQVRKLRGQVKDVHVKLLQHNVVLRQAAQIPCNSTDQNGYGKLSLG